MKKYFLILALFLVASGCEKVNLEGPDTLPAPGLGRQKAEIPEVSTPFTASFRTSGEPTFIAEGLALVLGGSISGQATHVGLLQEGSTWDYYFPVESGGYVKLSDLLTTLDYEEIPALLSVLEQETIQLPLGGTIHSANGDYYTYFGFVEVVRDTGLLTGIMNFTGGTGRFEGVTGAITLNGWADIALGEAAFRGVGTIIFPKR
jgi:hypothetical protein